MELDEMKQAWAALDRRMQEQHRLNLQVFKDGKLDKARRSLRPLRWGQRTQILAGVVVMLLSASFWTTHLDNPHFMVYGLLLHAYGLMFILTAARNLHLQSRLDYTAPVLEIQHRVAELRAWLLREAVLYGVTGCFIWIPMTLIGFALLGADVWAVAPAVVGWFIVSGAACLGLFYGLIRWSRRQGWERLRAALENNGVGRSVRETQALLGELVQFERD